MANTTERELQAWIYYLDKIESEPTLSDHYQMQTALEVARGHVRNPNTLTLNQFKLRVTSAKPIKSTPETRQQMVEWQKSVWFARVNAVKPHLPPKHNGK